MWSFRSDRLLEPVDITVVNLVAALGRYQGRQELFQRQFPEALQALRQIAIVESTEASNRIEGITVPPDRLRELVAQATPENRSEREIAGYHEVLTRIHTGQVGLPLTSDSICALHADLYAFVPGEGGAWKQRDNIIQQTLPDGREVVRFVPLSADETPAAMAELCDHLAEAWELGQVDKLLIVDAFVLDFLCIHPFPDGNGRLARLLTLLLLYAAGYEVGRYISLERIIESTKEAYYEALRRSGERWESGNHDPTPWHQYHLGVLNYAYREFERRVGELAAAPGAKSETIRSAIQAFSPGDTFAISDLERLRPGVSRATIRRVLEELRAERQIKCLGRGRSARWRRL
jgi:Fic family protein